MTTTYETLQGSLTVRASGAVAAVDVGNDIAVVGGHDAADADNSVVPGDTHAVRDASEAEQRFGTDSELARAARLARANGVGGMVMVPVAETETTDSFTASTGGVLDETPMDPHVHPEHDITAVDSTGNPVTVNIVYESPSSPTEAETMNLNPVTGVFEADSSGDYDVTYTYGDYTAAIEAAVGADVRFVVGCFEDVTRKNTLVSELEAAAADFDFKHGVVGAMPRLSGSDAKSYTVSNDTRRLAEVAPARCDGIRGDRTRTVAAFGGLMASLPVDVSGSGFYERLQGVEGYPEALRGATADAMEYVSAVTRDNTVAQAVTASTTEEFANIYVSEVTDLVAEGLFEVLREDAGGGNSLRDRQLVAATLRQALSSYADSSPPLLATGSGGRPYRVRQSLGADDDTAVFTVKVDPAPIMETVELDLGVGNILTFGGATA